jgi:metal-responsive CopG/Arc/MetJ family transcriptional regulator
MRVKTSVTLPGSLLKDIDRISPNRSAFLEEAARHFLQVAAKRAQDAKDARILDRHAGRLNREAKDVLEYHDPLG